MDSKKTIYRYNDMLVCEDLPSLHSFAKRVGLERRWFQNHPRHPHYLLYTPALREFADSLGAVRLTKGEFEKMSIEAVFSPERDKK
jgi:hypothetical protein